MNAAKRYVASASDVLKGGVIERKFVVRKLSSLFLYFFECLTEKSGNSRAMSSDSKRRRPGSIGSERNSLEHWLPFVNLGVALPPSLFELRRNPAVASAEAGGHSSAIREKILDVH